MEKITIYFRAYKTFLIVLSLLTIGMSQPTQPVMAALVTRVAAVSANAADIQVSVGEDHACALTTAGAVKCWGRNLAGELGNNSTTQSSVRVNVVGLSSGVIAISAGKSFTCALTNLGAVKCWGHNGNGQLGNNTTTSSTVPVAVSGLSSGVIAIAAGEFHVCALMSVGAVKCWGSYEGGKLGSNASADQLAPVDVIGLGSGVVALAVGFGHSCAVTNTGAVKCWGRNDYGQIGNNTVVDAATPVDVLGLSSGVAAISAGGGHTCALTNAGAMKCWGWNAYGQLGNNTTAHQYTPVEVSGLGSGVKAISARGGAHTCALTTTNGLKCWGINSNGQLGINSTTVALTPTDVVGLTDGVSSMSAGGASTCAFTSLGGLKCWGQNFYGELGNNSTTNATTPVDVIGFGNDSPISIGAGHSCMLVDISGEVKCWGRNDYGQLGNGNNLNSSIRVGVTGLTEVISIASGAAHTCAVTAFGAAKCWGLNSGGALGDGSTTQFQNTPVGVSGLTSGVALIKAGTNTSCALMLSGTVKCWGGNGLGQLGTNNTIDSNIPLDVSSLNNWATKISVGGSHACALNSAGEIKCWGANGSGQLGIGNFTNAFVPASISGLSGGIADVSAGETHTCVLTNLGGVKCWGRNENGQLGNNSTTNSNVPVDVNGLSSGVISISAGYQHTCALLNTRAVKCWGANAKGQLGNSNLGNALIPTDVTGLNGNVFAIATGGRNTCAIIDLNTVKCWGDNLYGQIGNGTTPNTKTPAEVIGLSASATKVSAGGNHTCVIASGGAKCWGLNSSGQLGDGSNNNASMFVGVAGLSSGVTAISAGEDHSCAIANGYAQCWGKNTYGQLGNGNSIDSNTPVTVTVLGSGVLAISAGNAFTCAVTNAGAVKCWGNNDVGQLGNNTFSASNTPVDVIGLSSGMTTVWVGGSHACAISSGGALKCWGNNSFGQLGDGSVADFDNPGVNPAVNVSGLISGVLAVDAGGHHTCAVLNSGAAKCWGANNYGQGGNGANNISPTPVDVSNLSSGVAEIITGNDHTCARTSAGEVKCWGNNDDGQLGNNSTTESNLPVNVTSLSSGGTGVSAGGRHSCAVLSTGNVKCWGRGSDGQLGNNNNVQSNVPVYASWLGGGQTKISAGESHTCALFSTNSVRCWGANNTIGLLGNNSNVASQIPVNVVGMGGYVTSISAGHNHNCAVVLNGGVMCWGDNVYGQLGNNSTTYSRVPVNVRDANGVLSGMIEVSVSEKHSCALSNAGTVKCWGRGLEGQLGNNSPTSSLIAVSVNGLTSGVTSISAAYTFTCANDGALKCWGLGMDNTVLLTPVVIGGLSSDVTAINVGGYHICSIMSNTGLKCVADNRSGQLGDNTTTNAGFAVNVVGLSSGVAKMGMGGYHSCAITNSGALKCWGSNSDGQLGNNSLTNALTPIDVAGMGSGVSTVDGGVLHTCAVLDTGAVKCWGNNELGQLGTGKAWSDTPVTVMMAGRYNVFVPNSRRVVNSGW